jgi:hypothetical protein
MTAGVSAKKISQHHSSWQMSRIDDEAENIREAGNLQWFNRPLA